MSEFDYLYEVALRVVRPRRQRGANIDDDLAYTQGILRNRFGDGNYFPLLREIWANGLPTGLIEDIAKRSGNFADFVDTAVFYLRARNPE